MENLKDIVVIYHDNCFDGYAGAWSAFKKFGFDASYIPQKYGTEKVPNEIDGKEVYVIDFCYSKEEMLDIQKRAKKLVAIDHHKTAEDAVKSLKNHVFELNHSGAYLAYKYFFPDQKIPKIIDYISDSDIWDHKLPAWEEVETFIHKENLSFMTFDAFEDLANSLESEEGFSRAVEIGKILRKVFMDRVSDYEGRASLVEFEGYKVYAVNAPRDVRSELGNILALKTNSFAIVYYYENGFWKCSLRSVKYFDVSVIASKYNGGGHKNAAAFVLPTKFPLPFVDDVK